MLDQVRALASSFATHYGQKMAELKENMASWAPENWGHFKDKLLETDGDGANMARSLMENKGYEKIAPGAEVLGKLHAAVAQLNTTRLARGGGFAIAWLGGCNSRFSAGFDLQFCSSCGGWQLQIETDAFEDLRLSPGGKFCKPCAPFCRLGAFTQLDDLKSAKDIMVDTVQCAYFTYMVYMLRKHIPEKIGSDMMRADAIGKLATWATQKLGLDAIPVPFQIVMKMGESAPAAKKARKSA